MVPRSKFSVAEDYPQRISKVHRAFTPFLREAINEGKRAYLQYDKLIINGERYFFDEEKKEPVLLSR